MAETDMAKIARLRADPHSAAPYRHIDEIARLREIDRLRDELAAKDREIAVWKERARQAADAPCTFPNCECPWDCEAKPAPDPVEAMRAKCEKIAREREKDWHNISGNPCSRIAAAIAALASESRATMACPICGVGTPHTHTAQERFDHAHKGTADDIAALKAKP